MDIKVTDFTPIKEWGKGWRVTALVDPDSVTTAKTMSDSLRGKTLRLTVREWREQRSLNANSYFHALVGKIAERMRIGFDECKVSMVLEYGALVKDQDGDPIVIALPGGREPSEFGVEYSKWIARSDGKDHYIVFAPTHTMDTAQFSRLLDGTISEAKGLGIETLPPAELERMMASYAQADKSTGNSSSS